MSQIGPWLLARFEEHRAAGIALFVVLNLVMNVTASASFKLSAGSADWRGFTLWQVAGNLAGFITVLTLTALLRFTPLSVAVPLTTGMAIIGVQIFAAMLFFHEKISAVQWLGASLIVVGIVLVTRT